MKLDYVEVCGFRGFRDKIRVDFGGGFTVITGRNGAGKSTLCDAVEYAVLGELGKYSVESSAKETVKDYIWWRGDGTPDAHYVTAAFRDNDGKTFSVTRTREGGADKTPAELEAALCCGAVPEDPLHQLCKTAIIRDEWIAALSLDLTETQRFELVRSALGSIEGADLAVRAKAVVSVTEAACSRAEQAYEQARAQLSGGLVQLSDATDAAARSDDVSAAMAILDSVAPSTVGDLAQRLDVARRDLPNQRRRLEGMSEALFQGREVAAYRASYEAGDAAAKRAAIKDSLDAARAALADAQDNVDRAARSFEIEARASELAASLSVLVEHGEALGLHDERCPLCAAQRTSAEFQSGIALARSRIDSLAAGVNAARDALVAARTLAVEPARIAAEAEEAWAAQEQELAALHAREKAHFELFERYELDTKFVTDLEGLEQQASIERDRLIELERALNALEASRAVGRLTAVDSRVTVFRHQVDAAADELARAQSAVAAAKSLEKSVRRSASEIVDERLALISPLLNELYQRLRPHSDWRSIEYSIRGDVRRFLSLKVGNDLNPQFVFSSGQRRAAGLAFLLSVHLARPWARWDSLLLDDPVQHIDDFRALHLVEVLAAFRQGGRQIICAVEDEALADLLCRRLLSTTEQPGRRFTIDTGPNGSADVTQRTDVMPMPAGVLRQASGQQAVG
jgi:chromosome segregation protein